MSFVFCVLVLTVTATKPCTKRFWFGACASLAGGRQTSQTAVPSNTTIINIFSSGIFITPPAICSGVRCDLEVEILGHLRPYLLRIFSLGTNPLVPGVRIRRPNQKTAVCGSAFLVPVSEVGPVRFGLRFQLVRCNSEQLMCRSMSVRKLISL